MMPRVSRCRAGRAIDLGGVIGHLGLGVAGWGAWVQGGEQRAGLAIRPLALDVAVDNVLQFAPQSVHVIRPEAERSAHPAHLGGINLAGLAEERADRGSGHAPGGLDIKCPGLARAAVGAFPGAPPPPPHGQRCEEPSADEPADVMERASGVDTEPVGDLLVREVLVVTQPQDPQPQ